LVDKHEYEFEVVKKHKQFGWVDDDFKEIGFVEERIKKFCLFKILK